MDIILGRARRFWSEDEKRAIVAETLIEGVTVASVARRHQLNANMLFTWRKRLHREETAMAPGLAEASGFAPVALALPATDETGTLHEMREEAAKPVIELDFESGARLRILRSACPSLVKAVIEAMTRQ
jgi:transposase